VVVVAVVVVAVGVVAASVGAATGAGGACSEGDDGGAFIYGGAGERPGKTSCARWRENPATSSPNSLKLLGVGQFCRMQP
jgi:hypothetical protein